MTDTLTTTWTNDAALTGFEARTLTFAPDDEGPVTATLVRKRTATPSGRAVLYLHGFSDYFFQVHLAEAYLTHGYHFYALDLRRHGRSLHPWQTPNFCTDLREYYADIDAAIRIIGEEEERPWLLLNGHSTGGLIAALYAHEGRQRDRINALFLNSPFFALNVTWLQRPLATLLAALGRLFPKIAIRGTLSPLYGRSLHRAYCGEWEFNRAWKPLEGFPTYAGWLRAIMIAQRRLRAGLSIACPILIMHASRSVRSRVWNDQIVRGDAVLNVAHMRRYGPRLGPQVTLIAIENALHDLTLSAAPVRERVFTALFAWLACQEAQSKP